MPLLIAMNTRLESTPPDTVVMLGDSTFASPAGCGGSELPGEQDFQTRLRTALRGREVLNFGLFAADWAVLDLQAGLLRFALEREARPPSRTWVVLTNFPIAGGSPHPVLFAQLCHAPSCDDTCRALCEEEGWDRAEGVWSLFSRFPAIGASVAGLSSYLQTFLTVATSTSRPVPRADQLGWRTLGSERRVTELYERDLSMREPATRSAGWLDTQADFLTHSVGIYRSFAWRENGPLQLWYKSWMLTLRDLPGQIVFVSQMPNPEVMAVIPEDDRAYLAAMREWQDTESLKIVPNAKLARLRLGPEHYIDMLHWSAAGSAEAARQVAGVIRQ
jgi:hypothetical protein